MQCCSIFRQVIGAGGTLLCLFLLIGCRPDRPQVSAPPAIPVTFRDVTAESGILFRHRHGGIGKKYFLETSGAGACFFDYDNDGDADLYVVQSGTLPGRPGFGGKENRSSLYQNRGDGRFEDVTEQAGVANFAYGQGCCAGDFDNDGYLDLYVTNFGSNRLYRNQRNGSFKDVTAATGAGASGYNTSAAFCDIDVDGDLDLYVARYARYKIGSDPKCGLGSGLHSYCPPSMFDGEADLLLRNDGGRFIDITREAGVYETSGKGLGVVFFDYNDDGLPDLFVANDGTLNRLYKNLGGGRFQDVTAAAGVGMSEGAVMAASMGVDAGDVDGDGKLDLFVAAFPGESNDLYRNRGDGTFDMVAAQAGLGEPSLPYSGFGAAFLDYDLDGFRDIMVANGHVADDIAQASPGITYAEPDSMYRQVRPGLFQDVSREMGADFVRPTVSRGLALADIDEDGDTDAFVNNCNGTPQLLRNDGGNRNQWVRVRLRAAKGDPFGIGARVTLEAAGRRQVRELRSGTSYCSQHDLELTFGLGQQASATRVTVQWPGRTIQEWQNLPAGQTHTLEERK